MTTDKTLIREHVCTSCLCIGIKDINCMCVYTTNYDTIELEFEKCNCCGHIIDEPADTEFNDKQLKKLEE